MTTSQYESIAHNIVHIVPMLMRNAAADLRCLGVGLVPAHYRLLGMLLHNDHNLSELAETQSVTLATMSNSVATLFERGWVERIPSEHDRRVVQVRITEAGKQVFMDIHRLMEQRITDMLGALPEEDLKDLDQGMQVLKKMLEQGYQNPALTVCEENADASEPSLTDQPVGFNE